MATISPGRAVVRTTPLVAVVALGLGGLVRVNGGPPRPAIAATVATALVMSVAIGQAPARLAWRLEEFADQVPGEPEADVAWHGEQRLEWPELGLTVEGNIYRYGLQDFAVHVGSTTRYLSPARPREAARTALEELGERPALDDVSDRLPSIYPRLAGLKTGALAAFLAAIAVGLGGPLVAGGVYPLWWWWWLVPVGGVVFGGARWLGLAHVRRGCRTLAEELSYAGVEPGTMDRTGGRLRLSFEFDTTGGSVPVRCLAVPYGTMTATRPVDGDETVSTRLPDPGAVVDRVATWRRQR